MRYLYLMLQTAFNQWQRDRAPTLGAALAFYTLLSLAPFVILLVSVTGLLWGDEAVRGQLFTQLRGMFGPDSARAIEDMVAASSRPSSNLLAGIVGLITLLFGATAVFGQLQEAMNVVWDVERKPDEGITGLIRERWVSFSMLVVFGFFFVVSLLLSAAINFMASRYSSLLPFSATLLEIINAFISFIVTAAIFGAMFKILAGVRLGWSDVVWGGAITAILFIAGKTLLGLYLGHSAVSSSYGSAGAVIVIPVWVYYSSQIFLFGAELTQVRVSQKRTALVPRSGFHLIRGRNHAPSPLTVPQ